LHRHEAAAVYSVRARVADLLTDVGSRHRRSESKSEINLSQEEIAGMLGTTRQVVNKVLGEISAGGAIDLRYGKIVIVDAGKLRSLARDTSGTEGA
jgi:CRP-like cAMP-binding protein